MIPLRQAWHDALYGTGGFYRDASPADHFRTSVHVGPVFARAIVELARREGAEAILDLGSGDGRLLREVHALAPGEFALTGVDVRPRPDLDPAIHWSAEIPGVVEGLVIANELLDDLPCEVVELDDDGVPRQVLADRTGSEELGEAYDDPWLDTWWPLEHPGQRAEIGSTRDAYWAGVVSRLRRGTAVAIDYGHTLAERPALGSLRAYAGGREVELAYDGSRDVTAHVAVDAVAAGTGARLVRQRDMLADLGVTGTRPPLELASRDPAAYVAALSSAGEAAELTATGGLGDFWWIVSHVR